MNDFVSSSPGAVKYRVGAWEANPKTCRIARGGSEVRLSPRSMNVLVYLAERSGETVTHEELLTEFWRGAVSSPNAVHKCMTELRHAFGNGGADAAYIETVPKRGYRMVAPVSRSETPVGAAMNTNGATASHQNLGPVPKRSQFLVGLLVAAAIAGAGVLWWLFSDVPEAQVITVGERSAMLMPIDRNVGTVRDQRLAETILKRAIARLDKVASTTAVASDLRSDYAVDLRVETDADRLRASLTVTSRLQNGISHHEEFDAPVAGRAGLADTIVAHMSDDLGVLLDDEQLQRMRAWGTTSVHAYRYAREGDSFQRTSNVKSLERAAELFRRSVEEDSEFGYGYASLSAVYHDLGMMAADTPARERARAAVQALLSEAVLRHVEPQIVAAIERQFRFMSLSNAFDAEMFWRAEIQKNPANVEALRRYGDLLVGAGLVAESAAYLDRAISLAPVEAIDWLEMDHATLAGAGGDFERAVSLMKTNVDRFPDFTISLYGLVRDLAKLGRYAESESYLARLTRTDPAWAYAAKLLLMAQRGDIPLGSAALEEALANPLGTNVARGNACFALGDVERGVGFWRNIEPAFLPLLWQFNTYQEWFMAPGVAADPRYQALLDELGIGRRWRAYMRMKAAELTPITGVEVTTPLAVEAAALSTVTPSDTESPSSPRRSAS